MGATVLLAAASDQAIGATVAVAILAAIAYVVRVNMTTGGAYDAAMRTVRREYEAIIVDLRAQLVRMAADHAAEVVELRAEIAERERRCRDEIDLLRRELRGEA